VIHTCGLPGKQALARHLFRHRPNYGLHWGGERGGVILNHAIIFKTFFSAYAWDHYFWPVVFDSKWNRKHLSDYAIDVLNSPELTEEHLKFQIKKKRPDSEFWLGLCGYPLPEELKGMDALAV